MAAAIDRTHEHTSQPESATTLGTIVEMVRRIMKADVASILGYSLADETVTWKAASGFKSEVDYSQAVLRPAAIALARVALANDKIALIQGLGGRPEFPVEDYPIHAAEGICDLAVAPMGIVGDQSGALVAGYRTPHEFTTDDKRLLQSLAELAAVVLDSARLGESIAIAEAIWAQTFDAIDEGMLVYDAQMQIIRCNARAAEMMDSPTGEVIGISFAEAFRRLFGQDASDYYLPKTGTAPTSRFEAVTPDGRRHIVSIFPIERDADPTTVVTLSDVTRLSEVQEQLARSRRLGSVGQLAAGVAHEINNPLAAISTCAEAVIRDLRRKDSLQALATQQWPYYLEEIVRQAQRCKEITRGLLDLTQQRQAKRVLCDLNSIVKDCVKGAVQRAQSQQEIEVALDENIGQVATDATMVQQILDNLLSNAADAVPAKGGKVIIKTARETDRVLIEIGDNGHGIPADMLPGIFDPFVGTKGGGRGYGLGLAICAALTEALGASLTVESKVGEGSKFRLWLPRRAPES